MTEFTTWRSLVDGDEISDIPDSVVLSPEDNNLDEFTGSTANWSINSEDIIGPGDRVLRGVRGESEDPPNIYSTSGLESYPSQGQRMSVLIEIESADSDPDAGVLFGVQSDVDNNYEINLDPNADELSIKKDVEEGGFFDSVLATTNAAISYDEPYRIEWDWKTNDEIDVKLYDFVEPYDEPADESDEIASVSANDDSYSDGGVGFQVGARVPGDDDSPARFDEYWIRSQID